MQNVELPVKGSKAQMVKFFAGIVITKNGANTLLIDILEGMYFCLLHLGAVSQTGAAPCDY